MKSLTTLIRLQQREIDVLKREQAVLEKKREDCHIALRHLADQLQSEREAAEQMPDMAHFFGDYAAANKKHVEQVRGLLRRTNDDLDALTDRIRERFNEMKTYEVALDAHRKREKTKAAKRETQMLDELAISQYVRRDAT